MSDGRIEIDGYAVSQVATIAPRLWTAIPLGGSAQLRGGADGALSRFASGHLAGYAEGDAAVVFDTAAPIRTTWDITGGTGAYRGQLSSRYVNSGVRVERAGIVSAGTLSYSVWGGADIGAVGAARVTYGMQHAGIGVGARWHALATTLSADRADAKDLVSANPFTYTDVTGRAVWYPTDGIQAEFTGGRRTGVNGVGRRRWAELSGVAPLTRWSVLVASAGSVPSDPARGTVGARYTTLAVRLTFGAAVNRPPPRLPGIDGGTGTAVSDVHPDGTRTLVLTLPDAHTVEIMGDFTDWRPVAMTRAPDGQWYTRAVLSSGAHRVNIRADGGEWRVPPGLPTTPDDFGGVVGVLVIH